MNAVMAEQMLAETNTSAILTVVPCVEMETKECLLSVCVAPDGIGEVTLDRRSFCEHGCPHVETILRWEEDDPSEAEADLDEDDYTRTEWCVGIRPRDLKRPHPFTEAKYLVHTFYRDGDPIGKPSVLRLPIPRGYTTWADLWDLAEQAINKSQDFHVYIQDFDLNKDNPEELELSAGS